MPKDRGFLDKAFDVFKKSSNIGKLMIARTMIEKSRKDKFKHLGELTYSLFKAGKIKEKSLEGTIKDLDKLNLELRNIVKVIEEENK
jgi:hypothetical protein